MTDVGPPGLPGLFDASPGVAGTGTSPSGPATPGGGSRTLLPGGLRVLTETVPGVETMTYREALRLAMREELERDESVFLLGEEIGVFQGSYKVTAGLFDDFGPEHMRTGDLIVYTSADSVLQIAAHVEVVPPDELYAACAAARRIMTGEHAVGRVIARPFRGEPGAFARTEGRRYLALNPPGRTYLQELHADGLPVHTVGKIGQVFNGVGVDVQHKGATNAAAICGQRSFWKYVSTAIAMATTSDAISSRTASVPASG